MSTTATPAMPHGAHYYSSSLSSARTAHTTPSLDGQRLPSLSFSTPSTAPTSHQTHSSDCENGECPMEPEYEGWSGDDEVFVGPADDLPVEEMLRAAGELPILSANGLSRPFKSLWQGQEHLGQRQLVVFIRHFYCGACQSYVRQLIDTITPAYFSLPVPTTVTIIGCGHPKFIPKYADKVNCPFPIYADPHRKLFKALKMNVSPALGKRPEYVGKVNGASTIFHTVDEVFRGKPTDSWKMGHFFQNGGEFLFEDGQVVWCHRMHNMRDHAEMNVIRRVLDMDEEIPVVENATAVSYSPVSPTHSTIPTSAMSTTISGGSTTSSPTKSMNGTPMKLVWEGNGTVKAHLGREISHADY